MCWRIWSSHIFGILNIITFVCSILDTRCSKSNVFAADIRSSNRLPRHICLGPDVPALLSLITMLIRETDELKKEGKHNNCVTQK